MKVKRTFDTKEIEKVIYHPEVIRLSTESGKGKIDLEGVCWIGAYGRGARRHRPRDRGRR